MTERGVGSGTRHSFRSGRSRGKNVEHIKDYVNATKGPWEYPHRGRSTRALEEAYPVLKRDSRRD
jgi:hypothetical protein